MSWSNRVMVSLDKRATVLHTAQGEVQIAREGQGPPVLAIHGGPGGFDQGLAWCRHLRDSGCEILAPSRPGYLRTPLQSGPSPERQADLYAAILDTLHIAQATILGFSAGGPSAVHFAARYPDRTTALFLDAPVLQPHEPPIDRIRQATLDSGFAVWLSYQVASRKPALMLPFMVDGVSEGLDKEQKRAAVNWITSDPTRLQSIQEQWASIAPRKYRRPGWRNDKATLASLAPLPFAAITSPTLIAHGTNDRIIPVEHTANAAKKIAGAELILVAEGHHLLSVSPNYGPVAARQIELAHGQETANPQGSP